MNLDATAGPGQDSDAYAAVFHRRIEFHVARKQFNGFSNNSSNGFKLVTLNPSSEPHKVAGSGMKCERSKIAENLGFDPELSFEITFRRIGAGLRNLGNTCYLNSVLQCLTYTEPLAAYLQSGKHQNSCRTSGFCALCAIQKHVSRALQSTGRILEPKDLVSNLRCISRSFRNSRQEDAHEYMVNLLESMHKCCLPSGVPSESSSAYEKSLVHKIFGGRLRSQVKCMQCSFCSDTFDPFLDLSLEIAKADSLHKALAYFTAKEHLDGGAKQYQCQQCKHKVKALKQLTIHKAPRVLTIHLKRFGSHGPGQKINKNIAFGPTLDLKPFVTGPDNEDLKYTLYGVLVHAGWSTHSGHYYCFVRTSSGMWHSLDDNQVVQVNERKVLEQKAYMLFYVRDRKKFVPNKPVDAIIQKEKTSMNGIKIASQPKFSLEQIQNFPVEKKSIDSSPLSGKDAPIAAAPMETPSEKNLPVEKKLIDSSPSSGRDALIVTAPKETAFEKIYSQNLINEDKRQAGEPQIDNPTLEKAHESKQIDIGTQSNSPSVPPATNGHSPCVKGKTHSSKLKLRRKVLKRRVVSTTLSSNILFGGAFCIRNQKHNRRNPQSLQIKNPNLNHLLGENDLPSRRVSDDENKDLISQKISGSGVVSAAQSTRGSDKINVARWDGTHVSLTEKSEPTEVAAQIGYVGDEWDEEYDRGKRKKIRESQISFGGPNLFQAIATRNAKRKKVKN